MINAEAVPAAVDLKEDRGDREDREEAEDNQACIIISPS